MFNTKTIIIVVVVVILAFIGYGYMISGQKQGSASGVSKQAVTTGTTASPASSTTLDGPGKEFVTQLLAIQNIKFNLQLFADPVFQGLQDWSRDILPQETGRPNPFAPLDGDGSTVSSSGSSFSGDIGSGTAIETASTTFNTPKTSVKVNPTIKQSPVPSTRIR